jgi:hypothetical protein
VTAAGPAVADRDLAPGQVLELGVQAGLVLLHDQDVVRQPRQVAEVRARHMERPVR